MNPPPSSTVLVALGSNQGDRLAHLLTGLKGLLAGGVDLEAVSSVYETPPLGYLEQPAFLNLAALGKTVLGPRALLGLGKALEREAGRAPGFRDGPRTLDVDLLFFGGALVREAGLRIPHPRWRGRSFVTAPLVEIAPGFRDPETGYEVREVARLWHQEPTVIGTVLKPEALWDHLKKGTG